MPTLKAYACRLRGFQDETIEYAETAGKARYAFLCYVRDPYPSATFADVSVRRAIGSDMVLPELPPVAESLDVRDREIVLHAYGGDSHKRPDQWGYRDHYCVEPKDPRLNKLVSLGLFHGPHGVDKAGGTPGWVGAFFYLTDAGKTLARALIGARESKRDIGVPPADDELLINAEDDSHNERLISAARLDPL